jgi:formamidopyrimidine-DNA glycosylase
VGRTINSVEVLHPRAIRRHVAGRDDFEAAARGMAITAALRRGKYLWLPVAPEQAGSVAEDALLAHLGMSGQLLLGEPGEPVSPHVRIRFMFADSGPELRFTDQRTFGHMLLDRGGAALPAPIAHIAPDPMEAAFDQSLISGVGNIYADEALWRARTHWAKEASSLRRADASRLLAAVREVLAEALQAGGTSFDSLYVNVNGESGYFSRSLAVYGREGEPCPRCGAPVRRDPFMNRSSYSCPVCQPRPRARSGTRDLRSRST